jgi:subfamily B ATP-binding cassette protein MsbA
MWSYDTLSIWVSGKVMYGLRAAIFRQLLDVGYLFFLTTDRGRVLDILRGETWRVGEFLRGTAGILISLCSIMVLGIFLVMISVELTLGAAAGGAIIAVLIRLMVRRARALGQHVVDTSARASRHTSEALGAMRTIRLFGQEEREHERFARDAESFRAAHQRLESTVAAIQPTTELLYTPLFLGVLLAAWMAEVGFPTVIGFMALLYRLQPHARRLDHFRVEVSGHLPAVQQIADLLDPRGKPYVISGSKRFSGLIRSVDFDGVGFSYDPGAAEARQPAVSGLTFSLRRNQVTAIVGESGAGKSTVVNLLFRLYDPTEGTIRVDGALLPELRIDDWRRHLAFAGQDTQLIGETILEAIAFARPYTDRAAIEHAAEQANAAEFIHKLPKGYDTPIGPEGLRLSVGQRQRLGLARALLCEPDILVLDEATNALDPLSEGLIQSALQQLYGKLTIVVIAHRLTSIRDADHVIVLRSGQLAEQGAPGDLLNRGTSAFAEMWRAQGAITS